VKIGSADPEIHWLRANKSAMTQNWLPWSYGVTRGLAVASIAQDDPSTLPGEDPSPLLGMHRDHNAQKR